MQEQGLAGAQKYPQGLPRAGTGSWSHRTINLTFLCDFSRLILWSLEPRGRQSLCLQQHWGNDSCDRGHPRAPCAHYRGVISDFAAWRGRRVGMGVI